MTPAQPSPVPAAALTAALRAATPRALAVMARRVGDFADAEDAVQEALLAASAQWPRAGIPDRPVAWLVTVASRRHIDVVRAEVARREREHLVTVTEVHGQAVDRDDTLLVYLLCCHPALSRGAQVALTLRCVGGLTTREIARGLVAPEATIAQRITRAKATLRGIPLGTVADLSARVPAVLDVLGLIHAEAHSAVEGDVIVRPALGAEALRLARMLLAQAPSAQWRGEAMGLVALILLTDARRPARMDSDDGLVPLAEQDRTLWRRELIDEGVALVTEALATQPIGPFQVRAAIAAVHAESVSAEATDWPQILGLYDVLRLVDPGPITELARAVAVGEVHGAWAGLEAMDAVEGAPMGRAAAVRAHLLTRAGRDAEARDAYALAARHTRNEVERRWLLARASAGTR